MLEETKSLSPRDAVATFHIAQVAAARGRTRRLPQPVRQLALFLTGTTWPVRLRVEKTCHPVVATAIQ
jgi:hypothetical protein